MAVDAAEGVALRRQVGREVHQVGDVRLLDGRLGDREAAVRVGDDDDRAFQLPQLRRYLLGVVVHAGGGRALRAGAGQVDRVGPPAAGCEGFRRAVQQVDRCQAPWTRRKDGRTGAVDMLLLLVA